MKGNPSGRRDHRVSTSLIALKGHAKPINPFPDYDSEDDESDMIVVKTVDGGNPLGISYAQKGD